MLSKGDLPLLEVNISGLTGSNVQAAVTVIENGSFDAFYDPLPSEYLFFPTYDVPTVSLQVNGIPAECSDTSVNRSSCAFVYQAGVTPLVTGIATAHPGAVLYGDVFTSTGSGFGGNS